MPDKDPTNPSLAFVGVSELDCQARSGKLSKQVTGVQQTLDRYLVKQQGRKEGIASVFRWGKWILIIAGLVSLLWAAVSFLEMKALTIAKANGYHQPVVEYAELDEDLDGEIE